MGALSDTEVLVIERACERLITGFFDAIDGRNEARLHDLFTEDATYARPIDPDTVISGRDAIVQMFKARPATKAMHHICSDVLISVESPDRATGHHRVMLYTASMEQPKHPQFGLKSDERVLVGRFEDVFVRTPAGWRFLSRRGRVLQHTA
jgi:ketosteroid isomerase-like protein